MEKILSFDVGIIHLAYCFFTKKDGNWDILDWAIIDLTDRENHKCSMCIKPAKLLQTHGDNKYYCKIFRTQNKLKQMKLNQNSNFSES
jgi:hypothetical protein